MIDSPRQSVCPSDLGNSLVSNLPVLPVLVSLLVCFAEFFLSLAPLVSALVRVLLLQLLPVELDILLELLVLDAGGGEGKKAAFVF